MSTVDLSERDNKETLFVKEEVTNDAEVFGEVKVDVEGSQKGPFFTVGLVVREPLHFPWLSDYIAQPWRKARQPRTLNGIVLRLAV